MNKAKSVVPTAVPTPPSDLSSDRKMWDSFDTGGALLTSELIRLRELAYKLTELLRNRGCRYDSVYQQVKADAVRIEHMIEMREESL